MTHCRVLSCDVAMILPQTTSWFPLVEFQELPVIYFRNGSSVAGLHTLPSSHGSHISGLKNFSAAEVCRRKARERQDTKVMFQRRKHNKVICLQLWCQGSLLSQRDTVYHVRSSVKSSFTSESWTHRIRD